MFSMKEYPVLLYSSSRGGKPEVLPIQSRENDELVKEKGTLKYSYYTGTKNCITVVGAALNSVLHMLV